MNKIEELNVFIKSKERELESLKSRTRDITLASEGAIYRLDAIADSLFLAKTLLNQEKRLLELEK